MKLNFSLLLLVCSIGACASGKPLIGEDGWPIRPSDRKLRCPVGTSLHDSTLSNGSRRVSCRKGSIPLARGFEAAWSPAGILTYLYTTLDDGTPISKIGYHINAVKSSEEVFEGGVLVRSNAWFDNGDRKYEATTDAKGTAITKWDNAGNIELKGLRAKGKREGKWQEFIDGAMEFSNYLGGQKNGEIRRVYLDGTTETGRFDKGKKEGPWQRGKGKVLDYQLVYENNELAGDAIYYHPNRAPKQKGAYLVGKKTGPWVTYYPNGKRGTQGEYLCGEMTGIWKSFHKAGQLKEEGRYLKGKKVGNWKRWNADGELLKIEEFPVAGELAPEEPGTCK